MTIAVLGLGSIGLRHARSLLGLGRQVIGFDPSPERRAMLEADGGQAVDHSDAAIAAADGVVIATPSAHHRDDLARTVAAGRHAFVEKPFCHSQDGVASILDSAESQGLVVFAAHNLRYHPCTRAARAVLDSGELGKIHWGRLLAASYLPDWRPGADYRAGYANDPRSGGAIFDFIHEFDLAWHLMGPAQVLSAHGRSGVLGLESEEIADAILAHESGARSSIHVDYVTRPRRRVTEIVGENGLLRLDLDRRQFLHLGQGGDIVTETAFAGGYGDDYVAEMAAFLACIAGGEKPHCDGREALACLNLIHSVRHSAGLPS